jgi:hypothetical protein
MINMYDETVKTIHLNADETGFMIETLNDFDYSSVAERLLVEGLLDKLENTEEYTL